MNEQEHDIRKALERVAALAPDADEAAAPQRALAQFKQQTAYRRLAGGRPNSRSNTICLLYTSPSPRDRTRSRMPSSA